MTKAFAAYMLAATIAFFQQNLQFMNAFFKDKMHLLILLTSIPISYLYFYSWSYFVKASNGSVWSARFIFFGLSYLVYPLLAYYFLNETPFSAKTIVCTILSVVILLIQYKL